MIGRLTAFDLPGRLKGRMPGAAVQGAAGLLLAGAAFLARAAFEPLTPGVAPFTFLFPAALLATGLAGWPAGVVALVSGTLFSWTFLPSPHSWELGSGYAAGLVLLAVSGGMVVAAAAAYRATALALRESQERLALATSAAKVGVWEWRLATGEMIYSDEAKRIYGFALNRPVTFEIARACTHPDDLSATLAQLERARDPQIRDESPYEYRIIRPDGDERWVQARGRMMFEPCKEGGVVATRYVGTLQDVTVRKADEERLKLLAREVDHRANNLLAVVQGTVALSEASDPASLKSVITGRVNALARAHQLLAQARWEGADLRRLVEDELLPFSLGDDGRVSVRGPVVALAPPAAQSIAMALHELATNAAKYGALSTASGRVAINWSRDVAGGLCIRWRESGGPSVREPSRKGLGTTLLGRALAGPIGGSTSLDWRPEGLVCELTLPATALEPPRTRAAPAETEPRSKAVR